MKTCMATTGWETTNLLNILKTISPLDIYVEIGVNRGHSFFVMSQVVSKKGLIIF